MSASKKKKKNKNNNIQKKNNNLQEKQENIVSEEKITNQKEEIKEENKKQIENQEVIEKQTKEETKSDEEEGKDKKTNSNKKKKAVVENKKEKAEEKNETHKIVENEKKEVEIEENTKELTVIEKTPDSVEDMLKNKKRKIIIFACVVLVIIIVLFMSTFFALSNMNNTNLISGIQIKNIDVSNLSIDESKKKIQEALDLELKPEIILKYGDEYEISLTPSQIEFSYDIDTAINNAYNIGRRGNILENNYEILSATIMGKNEKIDYLYDEELLNSFIDDISSKIPGVVVNPTYYIEEENLIINQGTDGISIKKEVLKEKILKEILDRNYEIIYSGDYKATIEIPVEDKKAEEVNIEKIYSEVARTPQDAYYELDPYQIYPDVDGIDFDLENAKEIVKEYKDEYSIPLKITKASKTINDLGTEAFPYLISSFSTKYDASNVNRSINLAISAGKINGKVLMPGEIFSYNKVVGKRTVEEGYKDAKIYADGGVVDGLAGGICQISSTLYNTVLLANLEIVERRNHSYPTSYVSVGRDATVVWGAIDFQFKNSRKYPIKIEATVKNGIAEFKIYGMKEENEYEIKLIPVTTSSIPYSTQYVQDPALAPGQQVVVQSGHAGYKVTTYIEKRLNGEIVSKDVLSNDTYSPMRTIIHVGPGVPVQ